MEDKVWHGKVCANVDVNLGDLKADQTIAMAVSSEGECHVYVDGMHMGAPWKNLPTDAPLYGVVGLEGENSSFRIGMLSVVLYCIRVLFINSCPAVAGNSWSDNISLCCIFRSPEMLN